jgi:hypothetical protein
MFAPAIVHSEKEITNTQRLAWGEDPGRRPGRTVGGHIDDMVALTQSVVLCPSCRPKFDAKRNGYITKRNLPFVSGRCDGCENYHPRMHLLVDRKFASTL